MIDRSSPSRLRTAHLRPSDPEGYRARRAEGQLPQPAQGYFNQRDHEKTTGTRIASSVGEAMECGSAAHGRGKR